METKPIFTVSLKANEYGGPNILLARKAEPEQSMPELFQTWLGSHDNIYAALDVDKSEIDKLEPADAIRALSTLESKKLRAFATWLCQEQGFSELAQVQEFSTFYPLNEIAKKLFADNLTVRAALVGVYTSVIFNHQMQISLEFKAKTMSSNGSSGKDWEILFKVAFSSLELKPEFLYMVWRGADDYELENMSDCSTKKQFQIAFGNNAVLAQQDICDLVRRILADGADTLNKEIRNNPETHGLGVTIHNVELTAPEDW